MRILIVDDNDLKVRDLISVLEKNNVEYDYANCRIAALQFLLRSKNQYDGIVLDMQFPNREDEHVDINAGYDFLHELEFRNIDIPVCMHSSSDDLDFSDYKNVVMYIKYDCCVYLKNQYQEFVDIVKTR